MDLPQLKERIRGYLAPAAVAAGVASGGLMLAVVPQSVRAASKQAQAAGAVVFHEKGCQHCHGVDATGTERGPDLSTVGKKWHKDRIEQQIREGGGGMPAFGDVLQPGEIQSLVNFLSAKRKSVHKTGKLPVPGNVPAVKPADNDSSE